MRKLAAVVLGLLLVLVVWSGAWIYLSSEAGARVDAWIAAEALQGRVWTCPNRDIGGYPLAITVDCSDPTYAGAALGQAVQASLAHLAAEASLLHPRQLVLSLRAPFTYQTSDHQTDVKGSWSTLALNLGGLPAIDTIAMEGTDVVVSGLFGQAGRQGGTAARLDTRFALALGQADPTIGFHIQVYGSPVPALDALVGGTDPIDIDLVGSLDRADAGDARTPEEAMEHWRLAGGRVDLGPSQVTRGATLVSASGALGLDGAHRLQGRLAAQFVGLEPILKRYGFSGNLAAAGSLLSSLFGGGQPSTAPAVPGALALPISFQGGRLGVGPIRTQVALPSLY